MFCAFVKFIYTENSYKNPEGRTSGNPRNLPKTAPVLSDIFIYNNF